MQLPSLYTDVCFKQGFRRQPQLNRAARLWTTRVATCSFRRLFLFQLVQGRWVQFITRGSQEGVYDK